MKDIFGNTKPVQIEIDEWWFNGRFIQKQNHPQLAPYLSFPSSNSDYQNEVHYTFKDAVQYCLNNPCKNPVQFPHDFLGGKVYYKIVQKDNEGKIKTLFHGINGTKILPTKTWVKAKIKSNVRDGVGNSYTSGIHIIDGLDEARKYLKRFRRKDRIIVECLAKGLRKKEKSRSAVYLADEILIPTSNPII